MTINAAEARTMTDKANEVSFNNVFDEIRKAALHGSSSISYTISGTKLALPSNLPKLLISLKAAGFTVKEEKGYDQRDGEGWHYLVISW